jgi:hypothetical protein
MKWTEYVVSLYTSEVITEVDVTINNEELIGTTEHLTLWDKCRINRHHYNRVPLLMLFKSFLPEELSMTMTAPSLTREVNRTLTVKSTGPALAALKL